MTSKPIVRLHAQNWRLVPPAAARVAQVPHTLRSSIATGFRSGLGDMPPVGVANTRLQPRTGEADHA
ncbi:MAG: hypothetical protein OXI15_17200 [Chromatiales bacterium]|nr:hypothetical protein [Chromatiales bacterium]